MCFCTSVVYFILYSYLFIREQFLPYLNSSFDTILKLLEEDDEDTIDAVLEAYGQLCINFSKLSGNSGQTSKFFTFKINSYIKN